LPTPSKISVVSKKEIGQRLRTLRNASGSTQARLARILGTHRTGISQIEVGHRGLTVQQVVTLAKSLRVSTDDILARANGRVDGELVKDRHLPRRMQLIAKLPKAEKKALLQTIDAFLKSAHIT
jgi:transcriptional regulator with XRE-family HTH domain